MAKEATWKNGRKRIKGRWYYNWAADRFFIQLDVKDRITSSSVKEFSVSGEHPEWGNWKLVKERKKKGVLGSYFDECRRSRKGKK